jgi:chromosome segregation ATPase
MNGAMNPRHRHLIAGVGILVLPWCLFGCATTDDPRQGGFVSGVVGLTSGGYEQRISDREHSYRTEVDEQQRLMAEAEALRRERARVQSELNQANRRLASLDRKVRQTRAQIAREQGPSAAGRQKLQRLDATDAKIARVRGDLDDTRSGDRPVNELAARSTEINRELDEIDTLVGVVSGSGF